MDVIGYVTTEYADDYVSTHFTSEDSLRLNWEDLDDEDKEILLRKSWQVIDFLPFAGRKTDASQPNAFPRYPATEVPERVKAAQVENALAMADSATTEDAEHYQKLRQFGIEHYTLGNLSETLGAGDTAAGMLANGGIVSTNAIRMLSVYLQGGYQIRGRR